MTRNETSRTLLTGYFEVDIRHGKAIFWACQSLTNNTSRRKPQESLITSVTKHPASSSTELKLRRFHLRNMVDGIAVVADRDTDIERKVKCVFLGDNGIGKTCLLLQLCYSSNTLSRKQVESFTSAYIANIDINGKIYQLELWDTECQEGKDTARQRNYPETDVFCLCFSIADMESFRNAEGRWYKEVKQMAPRTPIVLIGTKLDLRDAEGGKKRGKGDSQRPAEQVTHKEGKKLARKIGAIKYIECSALKQRGYMEVLNEAVKAAIEKSTKKGKSKCVLL